jgi:uncharacterized coiled-coil protein SlyX
MEGSAGRVSGDLALTVTQASTADKQAADATRQLPRGSFGNDSIIPTMVIRVGQASIEVDSLEQGVMLVRQLAQRVGGYVANSSMQGGREQLRTATLEIKLPASRFDQAVEGLRPIGKLEFVNTTAEDVGEEYVDLQARVANGRRLEQRLIELLATRTGKLADVLEVEQQLARVREEIERMEGRMRYLRTRSAVSTLSVTVHEKAPVIGRQGSLGVLGESFRQAWRNFIRFVAAGIESLGVLIPLAAIAVVIFLMARRFLPRRPPPPPAV